MTFLTIHANYTHIHKLGKHTATNNEAKQCEREKLTEEERQRAESAVLFNKRCHHVAS